MEIFEKAFNKKRADFLEKVKMLQDIYLRFEIIQEADIRKDKSLYENAAANDYEQGNFNSALTNIKKVIQLYDDSYWTQFAFMTNVLEQLQRYDEVL